MTDKHRLLVRILDLGIVVSFLIAASSPWMGWRWDTGLCMLGLSMGFLLTRLRVPQNLAQAIHMNLGFSWIALTACDDGLHGKGGSWIYWIPFCLEVLILVPAGPMRRFWLACPVIAVALVNFTPWTPHYNGTNDPAFLFLHTALDFGGALIVATWCLHYMLNEHAKALAERDAALERWKNAASAKSEFLSHMSHEFRTPLNAVAGFTDLLLQDGSRTPEDEENLRAIKMASDHLVHLVNDVLDLSRMENGRLSLASLPFSPAASLEDAYTTLRTQAREKNLEFRCTAPPAIPFVQGDRVRWNQILLNLMSNAIKYTDHGSVAVTLNWTPQPEDRMGRLEVTVRDTGPGIPPEQKDLIFERFERIDERDPSGTLGTGLGLSIARNLARLMDGDIVVESRPGEGSTFRAWALLPLAEATSVVIESTPESAAPNLEGIHVLLCDDTPLNVRLASLILTRLKATFDVAEDGGQAMEHLHRRAYDLVLLDLHMPVLDGYEVARAIRDVQGVVISKQVPILALTADASEDTRARTQAAGMDDFLSKPFRPSELAQRALHLSMAEIPA